MWAIDCSRERWDAPQRSANKTNNLAPEHSSDPTWPHLLVRKYKYWRNLTETTNMCSAIGRLICRVKICVLWRTKKRNGENKRLSVRAMGVETFETFALNLCWWKSCRWSEKLPPRSARALGVAAIETVHSRKSMHVDTNTRTHSYTHLYWQLECTLCRSYLNERVSIAPMHVCTYMRT